MAPANAASLEVCNTNPLISNPSFHERKSVSLSSTLYPYFVRLCPFFKLCLQLISFPRLVLGNMKAADRAGGGLTAGGARLPWCLSLGEEESCRWCCSGQHFSYGDLSHLHLYFLHKCFWVSLESSSWCFCSEKQIIIKVVRRAKAGANPALISLIELSLNKILNTFIVPFLDVQHLVGHMGNFHNKTGDTMCEKQETKCKR